MRKEYDFDEGRRGPVLNSVGKTRITIFLDDDVLEAFRRHASRRGCGYQTLINATLRDAMLGIAAAGASVAEVREQAADYGPLADLERDLVRAVRRAGAALRRTTPAGPRVQPRARKAK